MSRKHLTVVNDLRHLVHDLRQLERRLHKAADLKLDPERLSTLPELEKMAAVLDGWRDKDYPAGLLLLVDLYRDSIVEPVGSEAVGLLVATLAWQAVLGRTTVEKTIEAAQRFGCTARAASVEAALQRPKKMSDKLVVQRVYTALAKGSPAALQGEKRRGVRKGGALEALIESARPADSATEATPKGTIKPVVVQHGRQPLPPRKGRVPARGTPARNR